MSALDAPFITTSRWLGRCFSCRKQLLNGIQPFSPTIDRVLEPGLLPATAMGGWGV